MYECEVVVKAVLQENSGTDEKVDALEAEDISLHL